MQTNENASAGLPCDCVPTDALSQDLMLVIGGSVQNDGLFFFILHSSRINPIVLT
jgi:hypothetical protein